MTNTLPERYPGERLMLSSIDHWHGLIGHINVLTPDHKSVITDFGKHDRVIASHPSFDHQFKDVVLYARIDHVWNLGDPTEQQILTVCRKDQDVNGRWRLIKKDRYKAANGFDSTDCFFIKANPKN